MLPTGTQVLVKEIKEGADGGELLSTVLLSLEEIEGTAELDEEVVVGEVRTGELAGTEVEIIMETHVRHARSAIAGGIRGSSASVASVSMKLLHEQITRRQLLVASTVLL
jgi:hypothetical protein